MTLTLDVLVFHDPADHALATTVAAALQTAGYVAVPDTLDNTHADHATDATLGAARLTLFLWTRNAAQSKWVQDVANRAEEQSAQKGWPRPLGVRSDDASGPLPAGLRDTIPVDLHADHMTAGDSQTITQAVRDRLGPPEQADAAQQAQAISEELRAFGIVADIDTPKAYDAFLSRFPDGVASAHANTRRTAVREPAQEAAHNQIRVLSDQLATAQEKRVTAEARLARSARKLQQEREEALRLSKQVLDAKRQADAAQQRLKRHEQTIAALKQNQATLMKRIRTTESVSPPVGHAPMVEKTTPSPATLKLRAMLADYRVAFDRSPFLVPVVIPATIATVIFTLARILP